MPQLIRIGRMLGALKRAAAGGPPAEAGDVLLIGGTDILLIGGTDQLRIL